MAIEAIAHWRQERAQRREVRDTKRGYSVNSKRLIIAYTVELAIITVSLSGNWLLTRRYGHGDFDNIAMMMLAPIAYALVEFCRVPMAIGARIQTSITLRTVCIVGILAAVGITTKTVSQIGEMMFEPRLRDVEATALDLAKANDDLASLASKIAAADKNVDLAASALKEARETEQAAVKQVSAIPKDTCYQVWWKDKEGQSHPTTKCNPNTTRDTVNHATKAAEDKINTGEQALNAAKAERTKLDKAPLDARVTEAAKAYKDAIDNSQLHAFTAMAFGIARADVTDAQLHWFLRLFVFVPAICAGFVATIIALTSVTRLKPQNVALETAGLTNLGAAVYAEAHTQVVRDLARMVETAVQKEKAHV